MQDFKLRELLLLVLAFIVVALPYWIPDKFNTNNEVALVATLIRSVASLFTLFIAVAVIEGWGSAVKFLRNSLKKSQT